MICRQGHHARVAQEKLLRFLLNGPSAEAVPFEGRDIVVEFGIALRPVERSTEIPGHFGIGIQGGEGFAVRFPPTP